MGGQPQVADARSGFDVQERLVVCLRGLPDWVDAEGGYVALARLWSHLV